MTKFQNYDLVRVVRIPNPLTNPDSQVRRPRVGDIGAIVMVYDSPTEGYSVEAVAADGSTKWLLDFGPEDLARV